MLKFSSSQLGVFCLGIAISGLLLGCASIDSDEPQGIEKFQDDPRLGEKVSSICFKGNIDGFSDPVDNTIVLREGINRHYRVSLTGQCSDLRHIQSLAFERTSGCARRGDYILFSESPFTLNDGVGLGPDRCFINEIYNWDRDAKLPDTEDIEAG